MLLEGLQLEWPRGGLLPEQDLQQLVELVPLLHLPYAPSLTALLALHSQAVSEALEEAEAVARG